MFMLILKTIVTHVHVNIENYSYNMFMLILKTIVTHVHVNIENFMIAYNHNSKHLGIRFKCQQMSLLNLTLIVLNNAYDTLFMCIK